LDKSNKELICFVFDTCFGIIDFFLTDWESTKKRQYFKGFYEYHIFLSHDIFFVIYYKMIDKMLLVDLLQSGANVTVSIRIEDLKEFAQVLIEDTRKKLEQVIIDDKAERYIEPKEASQIIGVDLSTLWRWAKRGYLVPVEIGGKRRYKMSEIKSILNGGRN